MENPKEKIKHIMWFVTLTFILVICVWNQKGDVSKNTDAQITKETSTEDEKNPVASFRKMKKDTLSKIKEVFKKDKPVIIVTHVPYDSYTVKINDRITEYVLPPGYAGNITILTIE